jgi:predicted metal-binding protein
MSSFPVTMSHGATAAPVTEVIVCTTCRLTGASREVPAAGQILLENVLMLQDRCPDAGLRVRGIACMSGCSRACTVAFQAPGKPTYYFGDLSADPETAAQVLACATMHAQGADGTLPRSQRPERLRGGILAKLPPALSAPVA